MRHWTTLGEEFHCVLIWFSSLQADEDCNKLVTREDVLQPILPVGSPAEDLFAQSRLSAVFFRKCQDPVRAAALRQAVESVSQCQLDIRLGNDVSYPVPSSVMSRLDEQQP